MRAFILFLCLVATGFAQTNDDATIVQRPPGNSKFVGATRADFGVWIDPQWWKQVHTPDDLFKLEFRDRSETVTATLNAERETVSEDDIIKLATQHGRAISSDYKLLTQEHRIVPGGKRILYLVFEGTLNGEQARSCGYYYSGPEGTVQLVVFIPVKYYEEGMVEVEAFLDGIQIGTSGVQPSESTTSTSSVGADPIQPTETGHATTANFYDYNVEEDRKLLAADPVKAVAAFQAKSDNGDWTAHSLLALCYAYGQGVQKDPARAVQLMTETVPHSSTSAAVLGTWYMNGFLVAKDHEKARKLFEDSAAAGNLLGKTDLGVLLLESDPKAGVAMLMDTAKQGFAQAQYSLALCYSDGTGVVKDNVQKLDWMQKAAAQEYHPAEEVLAGWYWTGDGAEKNVGEAIKLFKAMAKEGMPNAQNNLACCLWKGDGVLANREEALFWFKKAAEQGHSRAQQFLGECYAKGDGVGKDNAIAATWFEKAAEQGLPESQYQLGKFLLTGLAGRKDPTEAAAWIKKAADQDYVAAVASLGGLYLFGTGVPQNPDEAVNLLSKAAGEGNALAEWFLAGCYSNGKGVAVDKEKAFKLGLDAAGKGLAQSQLSTGMCYLKGVGVEKNTDEAFHWTYKAAEQDNSFAEFQLGLFYVRGEGVNADQGEAAKWFRFSAMQGNPFGENAYGYALSTGQGVDQDLVEAYKWFTLATAQNEPEPKSRAKVNIDAILPKMTPDQIEEGKKRASKFVPKPAEGDESDPSFGMG